MGLRVGLEVLKRELDKTKEKRLGHKNSHAPRQCFTKCQWLGQNRGRALPSSCLGITRLATERLRMQEWVNLWCNPSRWFLCCYAYRQCQEAVEKMSGLSAPLVLPFNRRALMGFGYTGGANLFCLSCCLDLQFCRGIREDRGLAELSRIWVLCPCLSDLKPWRFSIPPSAPLCIEGETQKCNWLSCAE